MPHSNQRRCYQPQCKAHPIDDTPPQNTQRWRGHTTRTEIFSGVNETFVKLDPDAPDTPGSGAFGCLYAIGSWLVFAAILWGVLLLTSSLHAAALSIVALFFAGLITLTLLSLLGSERTRRPTMKLVWGTAQRLRWLFGRAKMNQNTMWYVRKTTIPVELMLDHQHIHWRLLREEATTHSEQRSKKHPNGPEGEQYYKDPQQWDDVTIDLEQDKLAFALTRPPNNANQVHLQLRDLKNRHRTIAFAFDPKGWIDVNTVAELPALEQFAVEIASEDRDSLLHALKITAETVGIHVPVAVERAYD